MPNVLIVGGGLSGLALAYRLQAKAPPVTITVLEQDQRPGGKIWTYRESGFQVEAGPNGFLDAKPSTLLLCRDLGLTPKLIPASEAASANRYLFLDGRLRPVPDGPLSLVCSDLLSWRGKLDLLLERFRKPRRRGGEESVEAFARRHAGKEATVLADAVVTGIHAGDPSLLSLPAAFPRLAELERQYGSVLQGLGEAARRRRAEAQAGGEPASGPGKMWSFREGLRLLVETLTDCLRPPPLLGVGVQRIEKQGTSDRPQWMVSADGKQRWSADAVILTCPAYQQGALLAELDSSLAERIGGIAYNRVAVVALGYRREDVPGSVDGFGYIAPQRTGRDLLGVQWCSSIFPERSPPGTILLRAMAGGWRRPEVVGWDDVRLLSAVRAELRLAMGVTAAPVFQRIIRWDRAIPQYHLGHLERLAWIENRVRQHPGLFLAGNAYHGVALNDCTEQAGLLAERVQGYLQRAS
jgi:oxygen-dependent protoporphyrinogen oxidase